MRPRGTHGHPPGVKRLTSTATRACSIRIVVRAASGIVPSFMIARKENGDETSTFTGLRTLPAGQTGTRRRPSA